MELQWANRTQKEKVQIGVLIVIFAVGSLGWIMEAKDSKAHTSATRSADVPLEVADKNSLSTNQLSELLSGYDVLKQNCPGIERYSEDIDQIVGFHQVAVPYQKQEQGWDHQLRYEVAITNTPKVIPRDYFAQGQRCNFSLNITTSPGMYISKNACFRLCAKNRITKNLSDFYPII